MSKIVADRYTKALVEKFQDSKSLEDITNGLMVVSKAFENEEFRSIIFSPIVANKDKEELILSFFEKSKISNEFKNFLKLLSENKRIGLIPEILDRLQTKIRSMKNSYVGKVFSSEDISDKEIAQMEKLFSDKFNSEIKLEKIKNDFNGIKVAFDELGVEINFSMDRLKNDLRNYILKAI